MSYNSNIHRLHIYIYIYILLRGVENREKYILYVHYKVCFIGPYYSETKNKIGKERRTFSNHAWFARWLTRLKEEEKNKDDDMSTPFHYLPIPACLELLEWTLGDLINHVFGSKSQGRTLLAFWLSKVTIVIAVLTSRCPHLSKSSVSIHPKWD